MPETPDSVLDTTGTDSATSPEEGSDEERATQEDDVLHPRPQFARATWAELDGPWQFANDDEDRGVDESWATREDVFDREFVVRFPHASELSVIHEPA